MVRFGHTKISAFYSAGLFTILASGAVMAQSSNPTSSTDLEALQQKNRARAESLLNQTPPETRPQIRSLSPLEERARRQKMKALNEEIHKRIDNVKPKNWAPDTRSLMEQHRTLADQRPFTAPDTSKVRATGVPADMMPAMPKHNKP